MVHVGMYTFYRAVLMGRRLFVRGFAALHFTEVASLSKHVKQEDWFRRTFYLK